MSLGTFLGAALGGLGLGLAGYPGTALNFATIILIAILLAGESGQRRRAARAFR
ncbi:hypothetical protein EV644_11674 [Kribbella orskensis]|uniref:Uncharacterized protein n=1 Tax=Kribbella orskensis TaxID=2512216 RepID=A0ABY2BCT1_9ACTN|nr:MULTISPECIES: hypothetical protein [Kribbella]TCN35281.1 hypothetical protein EV642_11774 [Kribbella sp. VKM Ac-2500]TCO16703.1 hypothetical protein EV644_11674 [Kribbella orskensis]